MEIECKDDSCCYCNRKLTSMNRTKEHIIPVHQCGANNQYNVKPCCAHCNTWKGGKTMNKFIEQIDRLVSNKANVPPYYSHERLCNMIVRLNMFKQYIEVMGAVMYRVPNPP